MSENRHSEPMVAKAADAAGGVTRSSEPEPASLPQDADPDAVVDRILALLDDNRYKTARQLAAEAVARFPDHKRVQGAWSIFENRGKARVAKGGPEPSTHEEFEWLKNPPEWAHGKWVALVGSEAVAAADTLAEVVETLRSKKLPKTPLIHRIEDGW